MLSAVLAFLRPTSLQIVQRLSGAAHRLSSWFLWPGARATQLKGIRDAWAEPPRRFRARGSHQFRVTDGNPSPIPTSRRVMSAVMTNTRNILRIATLCWRCTICKLVVRITPRRPKRRSVENRPSPLLPRSVSGPVYSIEKQTSRWTMGAWAISRRAARRPGTTEHHDITFSNLILRQV
jgi:hypothetical protein